MKVVRRHRGHRVRPLRRARRRAPQAGAADRQGLRGVLERRTERRASAVDDSAVVDDARGSGRARRERHVRRCSAFAFARSWSTRRPPRSARRGLAAWLARVAPARARGVVSIALVSDARVRALNRAYRRKDYATDVLSLSGRCSSTVAASHPPSRFLGDIVIARGVARRQARAAGHSERTELRRARAARSAAPARLRSRARRGRDGRVERRLRRKGGLREGLIERAAGAAAPGRGA